MTATASLEPGRISGPLRFDSVGALLDQAERLGDGSIDLSGVSRADSAGVALLLELTQQARARGADIQFVNAPPQLRGLIEFFELENILPLAAAKA